MKQFYKIENNLLISGSGTKVPEGFSEDWSKLATKENGEYYTYYNEDGTAELEKEMEADTKNLLQSIESSIQAMIDNEAKARGYDNIVSACSYAGYSNRFQEEAIKLGVWRSAVWETVYELQSTLTEVPSVEYVLERLPKYEGDK